jgi:hypothetical protein
MSAPGRPHRGSGDIHWLLFWPEAPTGNPYWTDATDAAAMLIRACIRQLEECEGRCPRSSKTGSGSPGTGVGRWENSYVAEGTPARDGDVSRDAGLLGQAADWLRLAQSPGCWTGLAGDWPGWPGRRGYRAFLAASRFTELTRTGAVDPEPESPSR